jgi:hypothetical protein
MGPRIEVVQVHEWAAPCASDVAANLAESKAIGKPFKHGYDPRRRAKKPILALLGVDGVDADPAYALALRRASRYRKRRCSELAVTHGYVSAGASGLVASASLALCASRYLYERAAKTGDPELLKRASSLANDARQNELAAWELCSRESATRPKKAPDLLGAFRGATPADVSPKSGE